MDWGKIEDQQRMVFKIPILSRKKWWQFWKKDDSEKAKESLTNLMAQYKNYWMPTKFDRSKKIETIKNKINSNYHSLYE